MAIEIDVQLINRDLGGRFARFPDSVKEAMHSKFEALTEALKAKVIENVSGKILQKQSGALAESIQAFTYSNIGGYHLEGTVMPVRDFDKAYALEFGGKGYYSIDPKGEFLTFFWKKVGHWVKLRHVDHPPSKAFGYMLNALEEIRPEFEDGIQGVVDYVLRGF